MKISVAALCVATALASYTTSAFIQSNSGVRSFSPQLTSNEKLGRRDGVSLMAQIPVLKDWRVTSNGGVEGSVSNHPSDQISDGDIISTSRLKDPDAIKIGATVMTATGSKYKLGQTKYFKPPPSKFSTEKKLDGLSILPFLNFNPISSNGKEAKSGPSISLGKSAAAKPAATKPSPSTTPQTRKPTKQEIVKKFNLNGKSIAKKKYLLSGKPEKSTSGKSTIWSGYLAGDDGFPTGEKYTIKCSTNYEAMMRESDNYDRITTTGLFRGRFVNKIDFVMDAGPQSPFNKQCALVIDYGTKDLRQLLAERDYQGLEGRCLREAAVSLIECLRAVHASGLVWTDCKTENFVILSDDLGFEESLEGVVGIDLESAISVGQNPVDFSPEACPPEFADAFINGDVFEFVLDYNYDIWSFGMLMYELSTGEPYFVDKSPAQVTKTLADVDNLEIDLSKVRDRRLQDMIRKCLNKDPRQRPSVNQLLLHPYFVSTGFGPFSF